MIKSYTEYLTEATQKRTGEIKLSTLGGGLTPLSLSLPTQRNPEMTGEIVLELYSKAAKTYRFTPTGELAAQMGIITGLTDVADEKAKTAVAAIEKAVKEVNADVTADLLQIFTQLDSDILAVLAKHGIKPNE
jgi:hypothetical protein